MQRADGVPLLILLSRRYDFPLQSVLGTGIISFVILLQSLYLWRKQKTGNLGAERKQLRTVDSEDQHPFAAYPADPGYHKLLHDCLQFLKSLSLSNSS